MNGDSPPTGRPRDAQWGRTYEWVAKRCRGKPYAAQLYGWLVAHYGYRDRTFHPDRERLADEIGTGVRTVQRALDFLRSINAIRTTVRRHPQTGYVVGITIALVGIDYEHPSGTSLSDYVDTQDPNLSAPTDTQGAYLSAPTDTQGGPECLHSQGLSDCTVTARSRSDSTDQKDLAAVDHRGSKQQADAPSRPAQQQQPPDPPDEDSPPTSEEVLTGFYVGWESTHGAPYDRTSKDAGFAVEIVEKAGDRALQAVEVFLTCDDPKIIGARKDHPLGLLVRNVGRLLMKPARAPARWCDHDPTCRSATQHNERFIAEMRAERTERAQEAAREALGVIAENIRSQRLAGRH